MRGKEMMICGKSKEKGEYYYLHNISELLNDEKVDIERGIAEKETERENGKDVAE